MAETHSNVEVMIYRYVIDTLGYNTAIACGILANVKQESGFRPDAVGDGGAAYGLFQWNSRRESLFKHAGTRTPSVLQQLEYMRYELNSTERNTKIALDSMSSNNTAALAGAAASVFCIKFERPANSTTKAAERASIAMNTYWPYYSNSPDIAEITNLGSEIVDKAIECIGLPYDEGGDMYDTNTQGINGAGLVYYAYREGASIKLENSEYRGTANTLYNYYKNTAKLVTLDQVAAADLVFYTDSLNSIISVALAEGTGGVIYADQSEGIIRKSIGSPAYILRILSDAETSASYTGEVLPAVEYTNLTNYDRYATAVALNLSEVEASGYDYGYLIDLTHGLNFKFYIPEFSESAGANYNSVGIVGRSVDIKAYNNTNSRNITVSLELYAGAGLYNNSQSEDIVGKLHEDINFIKSLEYPDYTNPIVRPPATVQLILGPSINLVGVVSGVTIEHKKPLDEQNRAMYVRVSFTVSQVSVNPPDYKDIRRGQYSIPTTGNVSSIYPGGSTIEDKNTNSPVFTGN